MFKRYTFFSFFFYIGIQPIDNDTLYQKIHDAKKDDVYKSIKKEFNPKNSKEWINAFEQCKTLAWQKNDPQLRDRLHEEIIHQKQPWYKRRQKLATILVVVGTFCATGALFAIGAIRSEGS